MKLCNFFPFLSLLLICLPAWSNVRTVDVITPEVRDLTITTTQPAFVEAYHAAQIGARVSGITQSVNADIGQVVKAGDVLAVIDAPELFRRRDAMAAEKQVAATKLAAEKANLTATEAETERILNLVKNNSVTAKAGDEATKKLESAKAQFAAAEASLKAAEARFAEAEAMVDFTNLKAPFEGVVTQRNLDPGDIVVGNVDKPLFEVMQTSKLRVVIHVPEKETHLLDIGDPASLNFNALPSRNIQGTVSRMAMALSPKSQRMRVEVDIESSDTRLYPGSYGQAVITLAQKEKAVTISSGAVRFQGGTPIVYVVSGGKIVHQPVTLGMDQGAWIEVTSGLSGNEQVVSGSIDRLPVGTAVNLR
jgi:HlyD family secretion protein